MSLSFASLVYQHVNRGGAARLLGLSSGSRYNPITEDMLADVGLDAAISSIEVYRSTSSTSNVILFDNRLVGLFSLPDFQGGFRQVVNAGQSPPVFANLMSFGFNDATRSALLVNTARRPEFRVSFRDAFLNVWNQTIDAELGGQASRKGDPLMSWEPFPQGISYLNSSQIYLKIHQRLNINIDWWPDYDASLTYHIYLYLDGNRRLRGYVQRWAAWVEGGIKSSEIMDRPRPSVIDGMNTVNQRLAARLNVIPALNDFYYLPGRQLTPLTGVASGSSWDDVTIVAEP